MIHRLLNEERGYSLVEVMASIVLLSLAILPMAGMFDMGLRTATTGSNYDKARTLANLKMEEAKSLPFDTLRDNFPKVAPTTTPYDPDTGLYREMDNPWIDMETDAGPASADFANFEYMVEKQYMAKPPSDTASPTEFFRKCDEVTPNTCATENNLIRVTVTVRFPNGSTYTTLGLVTR